MKMIKINKDQNGDIIIPNYSEMKQVRSHHSGQTEYKNLSGIKKTINSEIKEFGINVEVVYYYDTDAGYVSAMYKYN